MLKRLANKTYPNFLIVLLLALIFTSASKVSASDNKTLSIALKKIDGRQTVFAEVLIDFTPQQFMSLLQEVERGCEWIHKCKSIQVLRKIAENKQIIQTDLNVTWPFKDRDMIVLSEVLFEEQAVVIKLSDASDFAAPKKGIVRMTMVSGEWYIENTPQDNGLYLLKYTVTASPNGVIPESFVSDYLKESTERTLNNLNTLLSEQH